MVGAGAGHGADGTDRAAVPGAAAGAAAAVPGVRAAQRMQALSGAAYASDEMCLLVVMNTASLQLIPSTVAAVRARLGAAHAFDILPAVWLASACSVAAGILAARGLKRCWKT